jgi:hypothetical protein
VVSFLVVGYFCLSTELRFIIQLKDEISSFDPGCFDIDRRQKESEFWHGRSLETAIKFLPSDCPLLNHVLLSFQKHHSPSNMKIPEDSATQQELRVIKALPGIENSKFSPIISDVKDLSLPVTYTEKLVILHPIRDLIQQLS